MQRAQSDDEFRHAGLRSDPRILDRVADAAAGLFMHQSGDHLIISTATFLEAILIFVYRWLRVSMFPYLLVL